MLHILNGAVSGTTCGCRGFTTRRTKIHGQLNKYGNLQGLGFIINTDTLCYTLRHVNSSYPHVFIRQIRTQF